MAQRDSVTRMARRIRACPATESLATVWCFQSANGRKWRLRPPITLAGQRSNGSVIAERAPPPPPSNVRPKWTPPAYGHGSRSGLPDGVEPTKADGRGPYSRHELVRMDHRFRQRVLRAFKRGKESRQAAAAT